MTTLDAAPWLTHNGYRALVGIAPLVLVAAGDGIQVDALGRRWDPRKHPRGRDGRFIEVGGLVKFFGAWNGGSVAGTGTVERIDGDDIYVRVAHLNNPTQDGKAYQLNGLAKLNKRQIATVPQGDVRLDRKGNVHPHERELPDKDGKLLRRGDRVRADGHEGVIQLVGEDGRVAIRRDSDGKIAARRVEHVERLDGPDAKSAKPQEKARLVEPPTGMPAPSRAIPRNTEERRAKLPAPKVLSRDELSDLLQLNGFSSEAVWQAKYGVDLPADIVAFIRKDPRFPVLKNNHDRALRQVLPTDREERMMRDYRNVEETLNNFPKAPEARLDTPAPASPAAPPAPAGPAAPAIARPARRGFTINPDTPDTDLNDQDVPDGWSLKNAENSAGRQVFVNEAGYEVHVGDEYEVYDPDGEHLGDVSTFDRADTTAASHHEHVVNPASALDAPAPAEKPALPGLGPKAQQELADIRARVPKRLFDAGNREFRNVGFALDDVLDPNRPDAERVKAIDRALFLLDRAENDYAHPDARTVKKAVQRALNLDAPAPDRGPAAAVGDLPGQLDASHVPDSVRALTVPDMQRAVRQGGGGVGEIDGLEIRRAGGAAAQSGEGAGINETYFITDPTTGRRFIIKQDTHTANIDAEVAVSEMLRGTGYYGASYVEPHPTDPATMISTFAGEQENIKKYTLVKDMYLPGDEVLDKMADPNELIHARVVNAVIANSDRHGGNAFYAEDADGKTHLLLFDHGFAMNSLMDGFSVKKIAEGQTIAYNGPLNALMKRLGRDATISEVETQARALLAVVQGMSLKPESRKKNMITRIQDIIDNPSDFVDVLFSRGRI